jgi:hypothetical protein
MINRSLLEDTLDIHWVSANPEDAPRLADQHEKLIELGERAMFERFGRDIEALDDGEREELRRLSQLYDGFRRSWTLATDAARIALIKKRWEKDADAAGYIDQTYEMIERQYNALLHSSPTAFGVATTPGRRGPNRVGPDPMVATGSPAWGARLLLHLSRHRRRSSSSPRTSPPRRTSEPVASPSRSTRIRPASCGGATVAPAEVDCDSATATGRRNG